MKKLIIIMIIIVSSQCFSANFKLTNYNLGINNLISASFYKNSIAVLGSNQSVVPFFYNGAIRIYSNNSWDSITTNFKLNDTNKCVLTSLESQIHYDSVGVLWIGSDMLYSYNSGNWSTYFIDDSLKQWRHYDKFCIDAHNNLWITTSIFDNNNFNPNYQGYSELLKFDGKDFKTIIFTNFSRSFSGLSMSGVMPNSICALKDGRIVLHRYWYEKDKDFDKDNHNLIIYNQDGSYSSVQVPSLSGDNYNNFPKDISSVFLDDDNSLWLTMNILSWYSTDKDGKLVPRKCCSGLVNYKDGNWTIFNEKNGLPVDILTEQHYSVASPVYKFSKLNSLNYIVFGRNTIYSMGKDHILKELNLKEIGDNSTIIRANNFVTDENFKTEYRFDDTNARFMNYFPSIMEYLIYNNEQWVFTQSGIIVIPKEIALLGLEEFPLNENYYEIYPNPSSDFINLKNPGNFYEYSIYDQIGEKLINGFGENVYSKIDIRSLVDGIYFICLKDKQNRTLVYGFVKN